MLAGFLLHRVPCVISFDVFLGLPWPVESVREACDYPLPCPLCRYVWQSTADGHFSIAEDDGEDIGRGTVINIHLKPEAQEYTEVRYARPALLHNMLMRKQKKLGSLRRMLPLQKKKSSCVTCYDFRQGGAVWWKPLPAS